MSEWDDFYAQYRDNSKAPESLIEALNEIVENTPEEKIDCSDNVCVVLPSDEWDDVLDFLMAVNAPIPKYISTSPMHADPREMDNSLQDTK